MRQMKERVIDYRNSALKIVSMRLYYIIDMNTLNFILFIRIIEWEWINDIIKFRYNNIG